ncbi:MAG: carbohydrate ABC transporter permease [Anaerolineae bacterium]|nr:carbohydrate ABC transporter permease [Anaerolineae bacterium]
MKRQFNRLLLFLLTVPVLLFIYLPVFYMVLSSISTRSELLSTPIHWIPQNPTLKNYIDILTPGTTTSEVAKTFKLTLRNSLIVATSVTIISLTLGSMAAYALSRMRIPFRSGILIGIMGTRMIPEVSLVIPLYILAVRVGLYNRPLVLILTYLSFALPFAIWLMAAFFDTIPIELEDAARIDGASHLRTLTSIILPISAPGLVSTALFVFLTAWDEFFFALLFTSTTAAKTVPVAIAELTGRYVVDVGGMMTGGVIAAIPPVLLSLVFARYIVSGLTAGAVKG